MDFLDTKGFDFMPLDGDVETIYESRKGFDLHTALGPWAHFGLTRAEVVQTCETTIVNLFTCRLYAVKKNTYMRRDELLLSVSVTHYRR